MLMTILFGNKEGLTVADQPFLSKKRILAVSRTQNILYFFKPFISDANNMNYINCIVSYIILIDIGSMN